MSQIEIEEDTVWIPTKINDITNVSGQIEEYIYITLIIVSLLYSIRLLKS
jgi:hypothetical protein|tara:strand:- start:3132 stop:3281 length:150 start_codon:yes stop_codon:yes gene_type:complete